MNDYMLVVYFRGGNTMALKMPKDQANEVGEEWASWNKLSRNDRPQDTFIGGLGWGFRCDDVVAVRTDELPDPSVALAQAELVKLQLAHMKRHVEEEGKYDTGDES